MSKDTNLNFVAQIRDKMKSHNFMLSYRGNFSQDITKALLGVSEKQLDADGTELGVKKKVFNVMVECLQNVAKHTSEVNEYTETYSALFMLGRSDTDYIIYSGNVIDNKNVDQLKERIMHVNSMDKDELKEFYKMIISSNDLSEKAGAGLGLLDIAKKSGNKLDYDFQPIDDKKSFFSLRTYVTIPS